MRNFQYKVSRDADIVVAAMVSIVGSTLIFQGWRLDPLLLLCQALTTSVAFWYGLETFRLRSKEADMVRAGARGRAGGREGAVQPNSRINHCQSRGGGRPGGVAGGRSRVGWRPGLDVRAHTGSAVVDWLR